MSNYKNGKLTEAEIFDIVGATPEGRSERAMNVGEIMGQIMKESNLTQQILEHRAESLWTQVVGPTVAHSTAPASRTQRGPRIRLKWAGKARPFQGFA